jgi:hypothetical protein
MKRDDDKELWDLLGRAAKPSVSPFFARNVLREIRKPNRWTTFSGWLNPRRLIPAAGVAVALLAVVLLRTQTAGPSGPKLNSDKLAIAEAQDNEVIADFEDLFASDDSNSWEDGVRVLL